MEHEVMVEATDLLPGDEVEMTVEEWALQEKDLVDQFAAVFTETYGADKKKHPGKFDDMFQYWHYDAGATLPEDT